MARFFTIASLILSMYLVWCAAQVVLVMAHSGSEIVFSMEGGLERYEGDRNSPKYAKQVKSVKESLLRYNSKRGSAYADYAIKIACVAVFQFFVTLGLAFRRQGNVPTPPRS